MSHPTMGAWIEISGSFENVTVPLGRTPRWVRGLKFYWVPVVVIRIWSHPTMGAWIEIAENLLYFPCGT